MAESTPTTATPASASAREAELRQQLATQPNDDRVLAELGILCAESGRMGEGRDLLEKAVAQNPDDPRLHLSLGGMAANEGDLDAAGDSFRKALLLQAELPGAHVGLGQIAEARYLWSTAEDHFTRALKADPEHADGLLGMARVRLSQGHIESAVQLFAHVIQLYPRHARALAGYAEALVARGTPEQATRPLKRALELDPSLVWARILLGNVEQRRGNMTEAERAYRQALQLQPSNGDALAGLADALRIQNRIEEAELAYAAAARQYPDAETIAARRATCQAMLGRQQEAEEGLEAFIEQHPDCGAPRLLLADFYRSRGHHARAAEVWEKTLAEQPDNALAHAELAMMHEADGDLDAAAREAAGSVGDDRPNVRLMRARVALRAGDGAAAQHELLALKGSTLAPMLKRDRMRLMGLVHDRAGRWAEAVLAFREAHRVHAGVLPSLAPVESFQTVVESLLQEPPLTHQRAAPPVLLMGLPGSRVQRVAALLADQPGVAVRDDRFSEQTDFLRDGNDGTVLAPMPQSRLGVLARRYARVQDRHVGGEPNVVVDWLPLFDGRLLAVLKRTLPGVRVIIVDADPEDAYLRWLAFGWQRQFLIRDANEAAQWWRTAREQMDLAANHLPTARVDGEALLDDPSARGGEVASLLGLDTLVPGEFSRQQAQAAANMSVDFAPGHAANYREVLAAAFAALR